MNNETSVYLLDVEGVAVVGDDYFRRGKNGVEFKKKCFLCLSVASKDFSFSPKPLVSYGEY